MDEDVVDGLQVETLLHLRERGVEEVRQCHEEKQQAHDVAATDDHDTTTTQGANKPKCDENLLLTVCVYETSVSTAVM